MKKIRLSQGQFTFVDDEGFEELSKYKWSFDGQYCAREEKMVNSKRGKKVYLHRQIMGYPLGKQIDHINLNKLDNRRENLRICTLEQQILNTNPNKRNKSGFKGVSWNKLRNKWHAQLSIDKKSIYIGYFSTVQEAAKAYNETALKYHGEFARLNQI